MTKPSWVPGPSIITIPEAAALIGRNKDTVRLWCKKIPIWTGCIAYRNGRRPYLSVARMRASGLLP